MEGQRNGKESSNQVCVWWVEDVMDSEGLPGGGDIWAFIIQWTFSGRAGVIAEHSQALILMSGATAEIDGDLQPRELG